MSRGEVTLRGDTDDGRDLLIQGEVVGVVKRRAGFDAEEDEVGGTGLFLAKRLGLMFDGAIRLAAAGGVHQIDFEAIEVEVMNEVIARGAFLRADEGGGAAGEGVE